MQCICSTCKNLKTVVDEHDQDEIMETCEFGFPAESCESCEVEGCELTCANYVEEAETEEAFITVPCSECGKELKVSENNQEDGAIFCPICYLNRS